MERGGEWDAEAGAGREVEVRPWSVRDGEAGLVRKLRDEARKGRRRAGEETSAECTSTSGKAGVQAGVELGPRRAWGVVGAPNPAGGRPRGERRAEGSEAPRGRVFLGFLRVAPCKTRLSDFLGLS